MRRHYQRKERLKFAVLKIDLKVKAGACVDCGLRCTWANYFVFDWDHIDRSEKTVNVSMIKRSKGALLREIEKCELVCANCHRYRTFHDRLRWTAEKGEMDYPEQLSLLTLFDEEDLSA